MKRRRRQQPRENPRLRTVLLTTAVVGVVVVGVFAYSIARVEAIG
jgi:hypothetical protein